VAQSAAEFTSGLEEGTITYFDRVPAHCARMIDFGAYVGFTALHAASRGVEVFAFERNPVSHGITGEFRRQAGMKQGTADRPLTCNRVGMRASSEHRREFTAG
jgi:hypothetical protein